MTSAFDRFDEQFARARSGLGGGDDTLPSAVATAVSAVLPVSAASISIVALGDYRLPLAASSPAAAVAESLQFTVGDGPCLEAIRTGMMIDAPTARFGRRWGPLFDLYRQRTPYRSVASLPLLIGTKTHGAVNLFFIHEQGGHDLDLVQAQSATARAAALLLEWVTRNQRDLDAALDTSNAAPRSRVWVAVGMLMEAGRLNGVNALAVLRAHAYRVDTTIDVLAQQLTTGTVSVDKLLE